MVGDQNRRADPMPGNLCEEMVRACIARIEEVNPKLNAAVQFCSHRAIAEAFAADQALARSELKGPSTACQSRSKIILIPQAQSAQA